MHINKWIKDVVMTIKILFKCSKVNILILVFVNILVGLSTPVKLFVWKELIDEITFMLGGENTKLKGILCILTIYLVIELVVRVLSYITNYCKRMLSDYLNLCISEIVVNKVSELDMIQLDNSKIYDDVEKVNNECVSRSIEFVEIFNQFITNLIGLIGTVTLFLSFNIVIVLLCFIVTVPMVLVSFKVSAKEFSLFNERIEKRRFAINLRNMCTRNENIKEMKIYGVFRYFKNLMSNIYSKYIDEDKVIRKNYLKKYGSAVCFETIMSYGIKAYAILSSVKQRASIGSITMYLSGLDSMKNSIASILQIFDQLYENKLYMDSLYNVINLKPLYSKENKNDISYKHFKKIEFKNVYFKYPNKNDYALKNINLTLDSKKTYCIVGMNGSGKTTLIKLLSMLYLPGEGDILIDGVSVKNINCDSIHNDISVVFQDYLKYPLDVKSNIGIGDIDSMSNIAKIKEAAKKSGSDKFIEKLPLKYDTQLQKEWNGGVDLSLGQWQKVAIARALMADRSLYILDEPTASLDAKSEYNIFKRFKEIMKDKTCILISHRFSTVKLADEIIVIKDGEIIEQGSHEELYQNHGLYEELYNIQMKEICNKNIKREDDICNI